MEGVCVLGVAAVIFLLAAAFRVMFRAMPFSFLSLEAFSAGNALLFSGIRRIRYRRGPPTVRNMRAVQKTGSWGTRRIFGSIRCKKQASTVRKRYSVPETPSYGTGCIFRAPYRKGPLPFWHLSHSVQAMLSFFWQFEKFGTGEGLLWYGICARCKKQAPVVRDAFSGAPGAQIIICC